MARKLTRDEEQELIARLMRGDISAWEPLFYDNYPSLLRWARSFRNISPQDAEDIANDSFMVLIDRCKEGKHKHREGVRVLSFLMGVAKNKARERFRIQRREVNQADPNPDVQHNENSGHLEFRYGKLLVKTENVKAALTDQELQHLWDQAVERLEEDELELLSLYYLQGMKQQEMGRVLGQSTAWVNKALREAKVKVLISLEWDDVARSLTELDRELLKMRYLEGMKKKDMQKALGHAIADVLEEAEKNFLKQLHPDKD